MYFSSQVKVKSILLLQNCTFSPFTICCNNLVSSISSIFRTSVSFSTSIVSGDKTLVTFEVYIDDLPTGALASIDLRNKEILEGSTSLTVITEQTLTPLKPLDIYVYADGNDTITLNSCIFNIKRIGNI